MKVVCEKCESSFKYEVAKSMRCCPVCGEPFEMEGGAADDDVVDTQTEADEGLMYFDEIVTSYKECPELNGVRAYCDECGKDNSLELNKFEKLVDKEYVVLKNDIIIICRGCGKEHKPRKILYKKKDYYAPSLPHCPVCNSVMLKKITKGSKFIAAATLGTFALPYNSKTFECKDCGYRF